MNVQDYSTLVSSAWKLAGEIGLEGLNAQNIALDAKVDLLAAEELLPSLSHILLLLLEDTVAGIVLPAAATTSKHDHLFDCFMIHYDKAFVHKQAIKRIWYEMCWHPLTFLEITPHVSKRMRLIIDHVYPQSDWLKQQAVYLAYQSAAVYSFNVWLNDETTDQSKTMVALDTSLKQAAQGLGYF